MKMVTGRSRKDAHRGKRIGLALGGGGVRGLAHLHAFCVFDELGIKPHCIAGTSIGAVFGALYAGGFTGQKIKDLVEQLLLQKNGTFADLLNRDVKKWFELLDPAFSRSAILKGDKIVNFIAESLQCTQFEELKIPLSVATTDFWRGEEVVLDSGDLLSAIRASMAVPAVFMPVEREGRILVDGGLVNPLPCSLVRERCDVVVAVDVSGELKQKGKRPDFMGAILGSFDIVQKSLIAEQVIDHPPDILLRPDIHGVRMLDFNKSAQVYEDSESIKQQLRDELRALGVGGEP